MVIALFDVWFFVTPFRLNLLKTAAHPKIFNFSVNFGVLILKKMLKIGIVILLPEILGVNRFSFLIMEAGER